jgi:hypothetical protein
VSVFTKERIARMGLLNGWIKSGWNRPPAKCLCLSCYARRSLYILYEPLRTFSGGIRYVVVGGGRFRWLSRWNREQRTEPHALSRGPMTLIVLATTGLLACAFYIYVLCQWMRDTNGKRTPRRSVDRQSGGTRQNKRLYVIGSGKFAEKQDHSLTRSDRVPRMVERSRGRG